MRLALFGGTFDPPHVGHLLAASDAHELLALDRLVFVPAARQPLKAAQDGAPAADRLAMLRAMVGDDARFSVDPIEVERGGLSYTVDTLTEYRRREPEAELFFCIGTDALALLPSWRDPGRVVRLARLAVLVRADRGRQGAGVPGAGMAGGDGPAAVEAMWRRLVRELGGPEALEPVMLRTRRVDVSATEVRERLRAGKPVRGFVTEAVARYIDAARLYR